MPKAVLSSKEPSLSGTSAHLKQILYLLLIACHVRGIEYVFGQQNV